MYKQMGTVRIIACFHVSFKAAYLILDIRESASSVVELIACIAYKAYQYNINIIQAIWHISIEFKSLGILFKSGS